MIGGNIYLAFVATVVINRPLFLFNQGLMLCLMFNERVAFLPGYWLSVQLNGNKTEEGSTIVRSWIVTQHDYPESMMNKVEPKG